MLGQGQGKQNAWPGRSPDASVEEDMAVRLYGYHQNLLGGYRPWLLPVGLAESGHHSPSGIREAGLSGPERVSTQTHAQHPRQTTGGVNGKTNVILRRVVQALARHPVWWSPRKKHGTGIPYPGRGDRESQSHST